MKRFLVTGATSGVGRAVAVSLAASGNHVVAVGRNIDRLAELGAEVALVTLRIDFETIEPAHVTAHLKPLGPFDGIFHAAGAELVQPLRMMSDDGYFKQMRLTADSTFALLRAASSKQVMSDGASIVIMSSVAAHRATAGMGAYSAARAAAEAWARTAAIELAPRHVRVNCIAAGAFESPMHTRIQRRMPETAQAGYLAKHPLGFGMVREIRDAALFLLGDLSRWVTGTVMIVDGGFLAA